MSDNKKRIQAAWAILLLLWGLWPAVTPSGGSGAGSSSPASDPASDPSGEPNSEPASDPAGDGIGDGGHAPWPEADGIGSTVVVDDPAEEPAGDGGAVPWPEADPESEGGGTTLPEDVPNPMDSPYGSDDNNVPLPDALEGLPAPEDWAPWMPSPQEFADRLAAGAAVQVSILAPTGITYETAVSASTLAAAGALVAVDGPLPIGDAAAAGIVGPGFLMNYGIDASMVPGIDLPETEPAEDSEPTPDETTETVSGGETNDSTSTTSEEQTYTPDTGGFATSDPDPDTDDSVSTYDPTEETETEEQTYTPDSGGTVAWP